MENLVKTVLSLKKKSRGYKDIENYSTFYFSHLLPCHSRYKVSLKVCNYDFQGEGATAQKAKHAAASQALEHFQVRAFLFKKKCKTKIGQL